LGDEIKRRIEMKKLKEVIEVENEGMIY